MARQFSFDVTNKTGYSSPEGFWSLPRKEAVQPALPLTWEVPNRRNPRKKRKSGFYFYNVNEEDIHFSRGGEVTTKN